MHPFLPILSIVLMLMGDATTFFLWRHGHDPELASHVSSLWALIGFSMLFGAGLGFWLRKFRVNYPSYVAIASFVWLISLIFV
ncbi:MAG TPA: hypothetical protein DCQ83_05250 [Fibrobacteres bacterium]|jgi:hypothetical protein|nr:hypothetical protein [Fibrobacterota bacterium]